ncbi:MAG: acyl-CoA synthetase FdrA [Candidatus Bipolaricaulaceae bacterium]
MFRVCLVQKRRYFDSMFLLQVSQRLRAEPGVQEAAVLMGTPANVQILKGLGFSGPELEGAGPDDLVVAGAGASEDQVRQALAKLEGWLQAGRAAAEGAPKTLVQALAHLPEANLAVISLPGWHAGREAKNALEHGLNVFLFSSNVPVEEEVALKRLAQAKGLLVMGPDCGTALVAGVGLGFANAVRRGPVGLIAASGTGAQEFTSLLHRAGSGISHALGTGGRDFSDAVGGLTALTAFSALAEDPATEIIVFLAKPPGPETLARLAAHVRRSPKPVVACFLGVIPERVRREWPGRLTTTIDEAVVATLELLGLPRPPFLSVDPAALAALVEEERRKLLPRQRFVRGIFAGGTFCYQAQLLFHLARVPFRSNAPLAEEYALLNPLRSEGHTLLDMGEEFFTQGRLHPMIDPTLRRERILAEAEDPEVAVLLLDFVLGYNASPDPVGDLLPALQEARERARRRGGDLLLVASVCGTEADPQGFARQVERLEDAGVRVFPTQAQAVQFVLALLGRRA